MTVWRCPRCPYTVEQPAYVTGVTHRCNPAIPRAYRLVQVPNNQTQVKAGETNAHR